VQINLTETRPGAIRGLHGEPPYKLVAVASGEAFGAYVDLRDDSSTFGTLVTVRLTAGTQVLVPSGVGNGFQSLGATPTQYLYTFDTEWVPGMAASYVNSLDPHLAIPWPVPIDPIDRSRISKKDASLPNLH
jgi:dTDP-4-dehydrorhamnose 3,5-epimerase